MLNVLNFSSHFEDCGIAKYQENYLDEIALAEDINSTFFNYSPYQTRGMSVAEFDTVIEELRKEIEKYDIFHLQHEFGFYRNDQFEKLIKTAKNAGVKVVVTYHTSPDLIIIKKRLTGLGPRSMISFLKSYRHNSSLINMHITPLNSADLVLAHNEYTKNQLEQYGVNANILRLLPHPTYAITKPKKTDVITAALNKKEGDVILSTVGYIHRFKGVDKAIKSLSYLPANYKLAILGGVKSDSDDQSLYDQLADLIIERGLQDRVYISGVIPSDDDLNSYIRETDISLYPYDSVYYKGVSSGALNLAIANERPIVAYPVSTLRETNAEHGQLVLTASDSYYELARAIRGLDIKSQTNKIQAYAQANSWHVMSERLIELYKSL